MKSKISPVQDQVVVKRLSESRRATASGIILPDSSKEKSQLAEVTAVGPGKNSKEGMLIPMQVCVGDTVFIGKYAGTEMELEGETYVILSQEEVLAKVE